MTYTPYNFTPPPTNPSLYPNLPSLTDPTGKRPTPTQILIDQAAAAAESCPPWLDPRHLLPMVRGTILLIDGYFADAGFVSDMAQARHHAGQTQEAMYLLAGWRYPQFLHDHRRVLVEWAAELEAEAEMAAIRARRALSPAAPASATVRP